MSTALADMHVEGGTDRLQRLVAHQLYNLFFLEMAVRQALEAILPGVLDRVERCFAPHSYYHRSGGIHFNPMHTAQYCVFLYFASHEAAQAGEMSLAEKLYALNKALNAVDLFYEVQMPDVWTTDHPVGSVIGRAKIGNGFRFIQNCTVGQNKDVYPVIGRNVSMLCGATVLGNSEIGDNVILSARSYVKDQTVPDNTIVFGVSPHLMLKPRSHGTGEAQHLA